MRNVKWIIGILLLLVSFSGCSKEKEEIDILPASYDTFCYKGTEEVNRFAVDENGLLYTVTVKMQEDKPAKASEFVSRVPVQQINIFSLQGECIEQKEVELGYSSIYAMTLEKDIMYCAAAPATPTKQGVTLYAIDILTWKVEEVAFLEGYTGITSMLKIEDYLYVIGRHNQAEQDYMLHPDIVSYTYKGEKIGRINLSKEDKKIEIMNVGFPIAMYCTEQDTLIIYQYTEEYGFGFLEFNPGKGYIKEAGWKNTETVMNHLCGCKDGYIFMKEQSMFFGTLDGTEVQLSPELLKMVVTPVYMKGFIFYLNSESDGVERFCVEDTVHDNEVIKLLQHDSIMDKPYGCGFRMVQDILPIEQFNIKVLALDTDFDICLLSSRKSGTDNLRKNGAFYSLNDVEGVKEYLDACFPYVKELAYNEEGDIWMLPVGVAIPGIIYNKDYCIENSIDFSKMNLMDFLVFTEEIEDKQPEKTSISLYVIIEELFNQYFKEYQSFDTDIFRNYAKKLQDIYKNQGEWQFDFYMADKLHSGEIPDFYYEYEVYAYNFYISNKKLGGSDKVGVRGIPKLAENIGNVGTLTFLAVNPQSKNLEATLAYISAYAKYMLTKQNSFILEDKAMYTDASFIQEQYQLYANGAVYFTIDNEVYLEIFVEYLLGNIDLETAITEMERRRKLYMEE